MSWDILDYRTYEKEPGVSNSVTLTKHDANAIPAKEKYEIAYTQGHCWEILFWIFHYCKVFDKKTEEGIDGFINIAISYLGHLGSKLPVTD